MSFEDVTAQIKAIRGNVRRLVISGGEPMLQQRALADFIHKVMHPLKMIVEIETNGTIKPTPELIEGPALLQFNVSPKLSSSGPDNAKKRYEPTALDEINR